MSPIQAGGLASVFKVLSNDMKGSRVPPAVIAASPLDSTRDRGPPNADILIENRESVTLLAVTDFPPHAFDDGNGDVDRHD